MSVSLFPGSAAPTPAAAQTAARLTVLDEADRGLMAGRFHDGPVQDLLATRYLTDLALSAAAKGADAGTLTLRLEAIRDAAATALTGSRALLGELTARSVDGRNLTGALHAAAGDDLALSTGNAADAELPALPPAVAVLAHRLVRALRRSAAISPGPGGIPVPVSVTHSASSLQLTCDATVDLTAPELAGWLERAHLLGALVATDPILTVTFPLTTALEGP